MDEQTKKMLVGGFIAFIMVASVFVVTLDYFVASSNYEYNGFVFNPGNNEWLVNVDGKQRSFIFLPSDLEYINFPPQAKELLNAEVLTITYDPFNDFSEDLGTAQFYFEDQLKEVKIIDRAVLNNSGLVLEQKSCADSTSAQPVIELHVSNKSNFESDHNCIKIYGVDGMDVLRMIERMVYHVLGVMR